MSIVRSNRLKMTALKVINTLKATGDWFEWIEPIKAFRFDVGTPNVWITTFQL